MDALSDPRAETSAAVSGTERRLSAFRATDAFTVAAVRVASALERGDWSVLATPIVRHVVVCGGGLVAASYASGAREVERRSLESAARHLAAIRYTLYLARRIGAIDIKKYRAASAQHDAALRELQALLAADASTARAP